MKFTKMHGIGNDYVFVNCFLEKVENPSQTATLISDRHFGVGSDGLILITPSEKADVRMRIFNADGSEAEMCGNGLRCVAKYTFDHGLAKSKGSFAVSVSNIFPHSFDIETGKGVLKVGLSLDNNGKADQVCVNMGQPILVPKDIPVDIDGERTIAEPIQIEGNELRFTAVSMGNPHAVFFCDDVDAVKLKKIGPLIENNRLFPNRVNAHFVQILSPGKFRMRTWERGSGITLACGTGACACCVAAVLNNLSQRNCQAQLPGGMLDINWSSEDNCVYMTGSAVEVFEGVWNG